MVAIRMARWTVGAMRGALGPALIGCLPMWRGPAAQPSARALALAPPATFFTI